MKCFRGSVPMFSNLSGRASKKYDEFVGRKMDWWAGT